MCLQCVAQGAPMVGVAVAMLNRRNIKGWVTAARKAGPATDVTPEPEPASHDEPVGVADRH